MNLNEFQNMLGVVVDELNKAGINPKSVEVDCLTEGWLALTKEEVPLVDSGRLGDVGIEVAYNVSGIRSLELW